MTKDKTVTMSRELAEGLNNLLRWSFGNEPVCVELRALLAAPVVDSAKCGICGQGAWACNEGGCHYLESGNGAPVVERQEPALFVNPGALKNAKAGEISTISVMLEKRNFFCQPLYASPPAPVAVSMSAKSSPSASIIVDHTCPICGDKSGHMGWVCPKQKSAPVAVLLPERKAMPRRDDYSSDVDGTDEYFEASVRAEEHNACLDKVKELNQ